MKVNVVYNTTDAPHGGGNQFIKALKKYFSVLGVLASEEQSDIILFNSHHNVQRVAELKSRYPNKKFVHRVDGPMRLYNTLDDTRDYVVYSANSSLADGTVFQSEWSKNANTSLGMVEPKKYSVINNAVDESIFFPDHSVNKGPKTRIISASFSPNPKKGFSIYSFLDKNLDFDKFEMVFAGNSPIVFENIKNLGCLDSRALAAEMNKSHIYLTASQNDPCSNSLLEALSCNLPCVARNSGGHPELIREFGELFDDTDNIIEIIKKLATNKEAYCKNISIKSIDDVGELYMNFFRSL